MKKLTDKDAILCVSIEEAISIRDKFNIEIENKYLKDGFKKNIEICIYQDNCFSGKRYAKENGFKITKASKILNKGVSKKELLRRIEKLEKVMIDNTEVTVSKTTEIEGIKNELKELPEKWCVKYEQSHLEIIIKLLNWKSKIITESGYLFSENKNSYFLSCQKHTGYTEITFEQFKKWVLKEDNYKPVESDTFKKLSIREVQVKVNSQEEANECAEIAKACGEYVEEYMMSFPHSKTSLYFSVENKSNNKFGLYVFDEDLPEISIQEFRERFGKPKEIDWSKAGQLVVNDYDCVWRITGNHTTTEFEGVCIKLPNDMLLGDNTKLFKEYSDVEKEGFKLCTEPITLSK